MNESNHLGFNDWRLPSLGELKSLVKANAEGPAGSPLIDLMAFPGTPACNFWSGESYWPDPPNPSYAWVVLFNNGNAGANYKDNDYFVRLVRSGQ